MANEPEARIQDLPLVDQVNPDDSLALEHDGKAHRLTGQKLTDYLDRFNASGVKKVQDLIEQTNNLQADMQNKADTGYFDGPAGDDAYEIAVKNGYTGTEQEWLDSLKAPPEDIDPAVKAWLQAHPEATTTVQDGSITEIKLQPDFLAALKNVYLTPEMFGAKGDGVSDDLPAFNKMLQNPAVYVLQKDYLLSGTPTIKSGSIIYGGKLREVGQELLKVTCDNLTFVGTEFFLNPDDELSSYAAHMQFTSKHLIFDRCTFHCKAAKSVTVITSEDVHFLNCLFDEVHGMALGFLGCQNVSVTSCTYKGASGYVLGEHMLDFFALNGNMKNAFIFNCRFLGEKTNCSQVTEYPGQLPYNTDNIRYDSCLFIGGSDSGIKLDGVTSTVSIRSSTFIGGNYGVFVGGAVGGAAKSVLIKNCDFRDQSTYSIRAIGKDTSVVIKDCNFSVQTPLWVDNGEFREIIFAGNHVTGTKCSLIRNVSAPTPRKPIHRLVIEDNTIRSGGDSFMMYFPETINASYCRNHFVLPDYSTNYLTYIAGENVSCENNTIESDKTVVFRTRPGTKNLVFNANFKNGELMKWYNPTDVVNFHSWTQPV